MPAMLRHVMIIALCAQSAWAAPPAHPLSSPSFSFSLTSPTVLDGSVSADGCLLVRQPLPIEGVAAQILGLGLAGDDLDALSISNPVIPEQDLFVLLFSVDLGTVGIAQPDPDLMKKGLPFNMTDQAVRGHQAGDQFMSTTLFTLKGGVETGIPNNILTRNNYDEGGIDFVAQPPTSAADIVVAVPQDEVDAMAAPSSELAFYSATADSPSLTMFPFLDEPSGAHVIGARVNQGKVFLYASFSDLGLQQPDEIDALLILDADLDGIFNGTNQLFFSLAPGSPSLTTIPGASVVGAAADVFVVTPAGSPVLFASAATLGLGSPSDNIDALDFLLCNDFEDCAEAHAIGDGTGNAGDDDKPTSILELQEQEIELEPAGDD